MKNGKTLDKAVNVVLRDTPEAHISLWIRGEGPEVDDFDETVEHFFDDIELILDQNPKDYKKFELTHKQLHILKVFRDAFKKFSEDNYWPPEFIEMPEWERIIKMAKEVLGAFNYQKK